MTLSLSESIVRLASGDLCAYIDEYAVLYLALPPLNLPLENACGFALVIILIHFLAPVCLSEEPPPICHLVSFELLLFQCIFIYVYRRESGR